MRYFVKNHGLVLEGSASASYAAITQNLMDDEKSRVGFIACGRNISTDLLATILNEPLG